MNLKNLKDFEKSFLKLEEKERFQLINVIVNNTPAYDVIYQAYRKLDRVHEGDEMTLRELIAIGFNYIVLQTDDDQIGGYSESDFEEDMLDKMVKIFDFYTDVDGYISVRASLEAKFVYDESKTYEAISNGHIVRGILDRDENGFFHIIEREGERLSFLIDDNTEIKEI